MSASDKEWEEQLKLYFLDQNGKKVIRETLQNHFDDLKKSKYSERNGTKILSVEFDTVEIMDACSALFGRLSTDSCPTLLRCHELLNTIKEQCFESQDTSDFPILRFRLSIRASKASQNEQYCVPQGEDVHSLVVFHGTVIKVTSPRILSSAKPFDCGKCKKTTVVPADPEQYNSCPFPPKCPECSQIGAMRPVSCDENEPVFMSKDYQEIKVQEKLSNVGIGSIPRSIWVCVDDDLVDKCKPGDDVQVQGTVIRRWGQLGRGSDGTTEIHIAIYANNICVSNNQVMIHNITDEQKEFFINYWKKYEFNELEGRNQLLASFCPQVYGLFIVKLATSVILCGGIERQDNNGTKVRGEPHLLMVGDPGTGKSQILRYVAKLTPRSVMTSGIGSTNAGLTVSAVRDGPQWSLEAGALVLADGGLCCIDEFSSIREADRVAIHEAMEQQSISVAKAGVVTRLSTRCSILATANPKGKYDSDQPITVNIGIASPLLSRFDLVYVLLDTKNPEWDEMVSLYILTGEDPSKMFGHSDPVWSFENLKAYFTFCRQKNPAMSKEASAVLSRYYQKQRQKEGGNKARATVRLLQSSIRIAQGHARLLNHDEVTVCDAINAILLLEMSFDSNPSFLPEINLLHTSFPLNPEEEYRVQAEYILAELGLVELWVNEQTRLEGSKTRLKNKQKVSSASPPNLENESVVEKRYEKEPEVDINFDEFDNENHEPNIHDETRDTRILTPVDDENSPPPSNSKRKRITDDVNDLEEFEPVKKLSIKDKLKAFEAPPPTQSQQTQKHSQTTSTQKFRFKK